MLEWNLITFMFHIEQYLEVTEKFPHTRTSVYNSAVRFALIEFCVSALVGAHTSSRPLVLMPTKVHGSKVLRHAATRERTVVQWLCAGVHGSGIWVRECSSQSGGRGIAVVVLVVLSHVGFEPFESINFCI